ncbi:MAG: hypothetical protein ACPGWR_14530 [Ardenticatenaceae bacterium]
MSKTPFRLMIENYRVGCIIADKANLDQLVAELAEANYEEGPVRIVHGEAGLDFIDPDGTRHGGMARFVRSMQKLTSEGDAQLLNMVAEALTNGKYAISVQTDGSDEQRTQVHKLMKANGGMDIFFKGSGYYEFLT